MFLLVGGWTKSPVDGIKSRSLPEVIYQQDDVGRGIKTRSHGRKFTTLLYNTTLQHYFINTKFR